MTQQRRHFSPEQKVALLRQHLVEKNPIQDKLQGRDKEIAAARDRKLEAARQRKKAKRQAARQAAVDGQLAVCIT